MVWLGGDKRVVSGPAADVSIGEWSSASANSGIGTPNSGPDQSYKKQPNDADRIRKYLGRFGIAWSDLQALARR